MTRGLVAAAAAALSACASVPAERPPPPTAGMIETIRYETGPCFGDCPVYVVTASSDGRGTFEGLQNTQVTGTREFAVGPAEFAEFRRRLAPYRPVGERRVAQPDCNGRIATDLASVDIRWIGKGPSSHLHAYYGCDMERNAAMFEALRKAPEALPIAGLIGPR